MTRVGHAAAQERELLLPVHNPSQIPAEFKTFIEGRDSPFAAVPREGHLEPNESMPVKVGPSPPVQLHCSGQLVRLAPRSPA